MVEVFRAQNIGYFFYIGGNDSMDTATRSRSWRRRGLDLVATGVPKTIDNDVGDPEFKLVDHTPGYGSMARYWALNVQGANEENAGSSPADPVLVIQAMGRKIGFIRPPRGWPIPSASCRCRSTWPNQVSWRRWRTTSTTSSSAPAAASWS